MSLGVDGEIRSEDVTDIVELKKCVVYKLIGPGGELVIKFDAAMKVSFKWHKKFVNEVDPAHLKLRILKNDEIEAIEASLTAPRRHLLKAGRRNIKEKLEHRNQDVAMLKEALAAAKQDGTVAYKMPFLKVTDASVLAGPGQLSVGHKNAFHKVFFAKRDGQRARAWQKLGRIASVDLFVGNFDRFDPETPEPTYLAIRNLGNHMLLGNEPIGLDTWNLGAFSHLQNSLNESLEAWPGRLLLEGNPARAAFASNVVRDYGNIAGLLTNRIEQDGGYYMNCFIEGLTEGRGLILTKLTDLENKRGNSMPPGLVERAKILRGET